MRIALSIGSVNAPAFTRVPRDFHACALSHRGRHGPIATRIYNIVIRTKTLTVRCSRCAGRTGVRFSAIPSTYESASPRHSIVRRDTIYNWNTEGKRTEQGCVRLGSETGCRQPSCGLKQPLSVETAHKPYTHEHTQLYHVIDWHLHPEDSTVSL